MWQWTLTPIVGAIIGAAVSGVVVAWFTDGSHFTFIDWHHCHFSLGSNVPPVGDDGKGDCISTRTLAIIGAAFFGCISGLLGMAKIEIGGDD